MKTNTPLQDLFDALPKLSKSGAKEWLSDNIASFSPAQRPLVRQVIREYTHEKTVNPKKRPTQVSPSRPRVGPKTQMETFVSKFFKKNDEG
jgi:hypothetical protein